MYFCIFWPKNIPFLNPFVLNAPFLYPLKASWCFQGVEKGRIGKKWVKNPNSYFYPIFTYLRLPSELQKNVMKRFSKNFKNFNFRPKNNLFTPFWASYEFSLKIKTITFIHLLSINSKESNNRLKKTLTSISFGPKNDSFTPL